MLGKVSSQLKGKLQDDSLMYKLAKLVYRLLMRLLISPGIFWLKSGHVVKRYRIVRWLSSTNPKYLQVGGGMHVKSGKDWINGDIIAGDIYLDASKKLPFPDASIDVIFTEQFIEHLSQEQALFFIKESYRVLKKGGCIRHSTPDLKKIIDLYDNKNTYVTKEQVINRHIRNHRPNDVFAQKTACQIINDLSRLWGHSYIYDQTDFRAVIDDAGYINFRWVDFGVSNLESLKNVERHADEEWMKDGLIMICEAEK